MNWMTNMNNVLKYIERHLLEDISADKIAEVAYSSKFHFLRQFHMLTGMTLNEYIRLRRLSLASKDVISGDQKIIEIAYKYGYETPESFSKAFKKLHGQSPTRARKSGSMLKAIPPITIEIRVKGEEAMNYRIEKREAFNIIGQSRKITAKNNQNFVDIPRFWADVNQSGVSDKMFPHIGDLGLMGVCYDMNMELEEFHYMIGVQGTELADIEDTTVIDVPTQTWAVFECIGPLPDVIQSVWKRIFSEWFPATKYEHADAPELEAYLPGDPSAEDYKCEIWIPVVEK